MNDTIGIIIALLLCVLLFTIISKRITDDTRVNEVLTDQYAWLAYGIQRDWMRSYCGTHDSYFTHEEAEAFEEYDDPCYLIYRVMGDER